MYTVQFSNLTFCWGENGLTSGHFTFLQFDWRSQTGLTEPRVLLWPGWPGSILGIWLDFCGFCAQSCPAVCDPMDYSLPGSYIHGILQARILEWVAMPSSRRSLVSPTSPASAGGFFTTAPPGKSVASLSRTV